MPKYRVLTNSKFGLFYSNFLIVTPTFLKAPIERYGKTPNFSGRRHFYSCFQNPCENSVNSNRTEIDSDMTSLVTICNLLWSTYLWSFIQIFHIEKELQVKNIFQINQGRITHELER